MEEAERNSRARGQLFPHHIPILGHDQAPLDKAGPIFFYPNDKLNGTHSLQPSKEKVY